MQKALIVVRVKFKPTNKLKQKIGEVLCFTLISDKSDV